MAIRAVAGAPPPSKTIARVEAELGWEFNQIYGLTETAPLLTINRPRAEYDDLSPYDRAVRLGRAGAPALGIELDVDPEGEVLARGNVILAGYWNQPEASAEALRDATSNDEFRTMLERLLGVKERHGAFFAAQTRDRLRRSPKAAKLTRKRLNRQHWPLGAIDEDPQLAARFFETLLPDATIAAIDARSADDVSRTPTSSEP